MTTLLAALIYRPDQVSPRALAQGFAVALAGYDVVAPRLLVGPLPGARGHAIAFYTSGSLPRGAEDEEFEHACELFEGELPPGLCVRELAAAAGHSDAVVHALTYAEDMIHDDAWRFDAEGAVYHYAHEGDAVIEAGVVTAERDDAAAIPLDVGGDLSDGAASEAVARAVRPHRGTTFLSNELGTPLLGALMGALYTADRRVDVRLVEPTPDAVVAELGRLHQVLRRVAGRGAFTPPAVGGVAAPPVVAAFAQRYDWADPADPQDLYRGLAIGRVEGTLRFLREAELRALDQDPAWARSAAEGLYPIARLTSSALGAAGAPIGTIALAPDHDRLLLARPSGVAVVAGPTFGELIAYLALGWAKRSAIEEELIDALMLRARVRSGAHALDRIADA